MTQRLIKKNNLLITKQSQPRKFLYCMIPIQMFYFYGVFRKNLNSTTSESSNGRKFHTRSINNHFLPTKEMVLALKSLYFLFVAIK